MSDFPGGDEMRDLGLVAPAPNLLRALPHQLVETERGVLLRRGVTTLAVDGQGAADALCRVLDGVAEGVPRDKIRLWFAEPDREQVDDLISRLVAHRILVAAEEEPPRDEPAVERPLDVFYWNLGARADIVADRIDARHVTILGVNEISRRLVAALDAADVSSFDVVDYHLLRNVRLFDGDGALSRERWGVDHVPVEYGDWADTVDEDDPGCVVATSDFGLSPPIREWNRFCVENGWHFLPVVLHEFVGYVGPFVVPGEGPCYECLRARENSHMENPAVRRAPERTAFVGQTVQGFHPSMASVLGDVAAIELTKFYGELPLARVGALVEVNLLVPSLTTRRVLKVPRCGVCSSLRTAVPAALDTLVYRLNE